MIKPKSSDLSSIPAIEITKDAAGEQYVSDSEYQDGSRRNSRSQQIQQQQAQVRLLSRPGVYICASGFNCYIAVYYLLLLINYLIV